MRASGEFYGPRIAADQRLQQQTEEGASCNESAACDAVADGFGLNQFIRGKVASQPIQQLLAAIKAGSPDLDGLVLENGNEWVHHVGTFAAAPGDPETQARTCSIGPR